MDKTQVRTAADLEKKYNFAQMLGLTKNVENQQQQLIRIQNELNNMLNSLVINLGDLLDSQSSISLWFYDGVPTTSNKPYTDWNDPTEHYGDFYYDRLSGYVYEFTENGWEQQTDTNLINAMALTNVELDVEQDHERQVFFSTPTPPYQSGDWWILEDGTLMICQIGKPSGVYEEFDFINSSRYTETIAAKVDNQLTVTRGRVEVIYDAQEGLKSTVTSIDETVNGTPTYVITVDTEFQEDKPYYKLYNDGYIELIEGTDYNDGDLISSVGYDVYDVIYENTMMDVMDSTINNALYGQNGAEARITQTILDQSSTAFTMWFSDSGYATQLANATAAANSALTKDYLDNYIRFTTYQGQPCIEIGETSSSSRIRILPTIIEFLNGENRVAYMSNNALYIEENTILSKQTIGKNNIGRWITELDNSGNLNTYWGG